MSFPKEIEAFITHFVDELNDNNAAIFAGAGLSAASGHVDWKGLLRDVAADLGLNIDIEDDLISLAQYYLNKNSANRHTLNQKILNHFHGGEPNDNHHLLARLPISTYWTTNYDKLIERAFEQVGKVCDVKHRTRSLANTLDGRDVVLYKMHGDIDSADEAIISKDQYEKYFSTHGAFINALTGDLTFKTFLFLGFSFTDPNLDYIFSRIRVTFQDNARKHYCFFRQIERQSGESESDCEYRRTKQNLVIKDLQRFNIDVLLVDSFDIITEVLREIENRYRRQTIYISGSAHDYGQWSAGDAETFITELSKAIVQNGFKIISGFGLGVGSFVINGVLEEVYLSKRQRLSDELLLRPFPQGEEGQKQWESYRKDMISYAGISIFIFGNKSVDGKVVAATGVRSEFEIAIGQGLIPIPIGSTGYVAKELSDEVLADALNIYKSYEWMEPLIKKLGDPQTPKRSLIEITIEIIKKLQEQ